MSKHYTCRKSSVALSVKNKHPTNVLRRVYRDQSTGLAGYILGGTAVAPRDCGVLLAEL